MRPALVLTEEKAAEAGYSGSGPFTFPGNFPGVYVPGQPLALTEIGFATEEDAREALKATDVPLEWTEVEAGEGLAERDNHALRSDLAVQAEVDEAQTIRTHAEADKVAADLGITFSESPRPTVAEKVKAIEAVRLADPGDPDALTPAPGATVPEPDVEAAAE